MSAFPGAARFLKHLYGRSAAYYGRRGVTSRCHVEVCLVRRPRGPSNTCTVVGLLPADAEVWWRGVPERCAFSGAPAIARARLRPPGCI